MKKHIKEVLDKYVADMKAAAKEDIPKIREQFATWYISLSVEEQAQMQPFWQEVKKYAKAAIEEINASLTELRSLKEVKLLVGSYEYILNEWVTISDYSRRHNLKNQPCSKLDNTRGHTG